MCCQTVRESAVSAVRLSGTVRRCPGFAVRLSDQGSGKTPKSMRVAENESNLEDQFFREKIVRFVF